MWVAEGTAGAAVKEQESGIDWNYETSPDSEKRIFNNSKETG